MIVFQVRAFPALIYCAPVRPSSRFKPLYILLDHSTVVAPGNVCAQGRVRHIRKKVVNICIFAANQTIGSTLVVLHAFHKAAILNQPAKEALLVVVMQ